MAIINAKYAGRCNTCSKPVTVGQRVVWHRGSTGVSCCNPSLTAARPRRRGESVEARAERERAEMERERDFRPVSKRAVESVGATLAVCSECADTKIGDDGFKCESCPARVGLTINDVATLGHDVAAQLAEPPAHVDDFGPMPSDDDLPF